jgi:hypothetical protein
VSDKALNALKGLSQLESLSVTDGALIAGAHLESLGTLTNLRRLAFQYYPYDTAPTGHKELAKLRQLRELDLELSGQGVAKFSDSILEVIATLDGLEELGIHCVISDAGLHALKALKKLKSLDLTKCSGYTDRGLATLVESLPGLQIIRFSMNQAPMGDQRKR